MVANSSGGQKDFKGEPFRDIYIATAVSQSG